MLHCISSFFSPSGYKRPLENYLIFLEQLAEKNIPYTIVELSTNGSWMIPEASYKNHRVIRLEGSPKANMWQQRRLVNYVIEHHLPANTDKVCWIDPDILFERDDWYGATEEALDKYTLVQPFGRLYRLADFQRHKTKDTYGMDSAFKLITEGQSYTDITGFAWASQMWFLKATCGLFDYDILGGGDTFMLNALLDKPHPSFGGGDFDWGLEMYSQNVRTVLPYVKMGYVPGEAYHLYHGSMANRKYWERYETIVRHNFSPYTDVSKAAGFWEWISEKPELHAEVQGYFDNRREDEILGLTN